MVPVPVPIGVGAINNNNNSNNNSNNNNNNNICIKIVQNSAIVAYQVHLIGKPSCLTRLTSITPMHWSCLFTRKGSNMPARVRAFGFTQRTNWHCAERNSVNRVVKSLLNLLEIVAVSLSCGAGTPISSPVESADRRFCMPAMRVLSLSSLKLWLYSYSRRTRGLDPWRRLSSTLESSLSRFFSASSANVYLTVSAKCFIVKVPNPELCEVDVPEFLIGIRVFELEVSWFDVWLWRPSLWRSMLTQLLPLQLDSIVAKSEFTSFKFLPSKQNESRARSRPFGGRISAVCS